MIRWLAARLWRRQTMQPAWVAEFERSHPGRCLYCSYTRWMSFSHNQKLPLAPHDLYRGKQPTASTTVRESPPMKKIPSLFARDPANPHVLSDEYHPAADWVVRGEGVETRKWDGSAVLIRAGLLYARYDAKRGKEPPPGFTPAQDPDAITGHWPGWVPATRPGDVWLRTAARAAGDAMTIFEDGTYEACGPKISGNPERLDGHRLIRHGADVLADVPRDKAGLLDFFRATNIEGIVWWRVLNDPESAMVKITGEALGIKRP